jgi:prepilin signal peptidase PulO-like enzyme (type II secretory pathway)
LAASAVTVAVWIWGGDHWEAMLTAWIGLAVGGLLVWVVRIVGTKLLGREAMGFGDVTLLAMIGAFLGWQSCLVIFLLAPLAGAVIGVIQWLLNRGNEIRYGPFLCLAAWVTIVRWAPIWEGIYPMFIDGWLVPIALGVCLLLMAPLLWIVRQIGDRLRGSP